MDVFSSIVLEFTRLEDQNVRPRFDLRWSTDRITEELEFLPLSLELGLALKPEVFLSLSVDRINHGEQVGVEGLGHFHDY